MTCGIYSIKNKNNGFKYVGSSKHIEYRFSQHKELLANNQHHSKKFQSAWNEFGPEGFSFEIQSAGAFSCVQLEILEFVAISEANSITSGYNMTSDTTREDGGLSELVIKICEKQLELSKEESGYNELLREGHEWDEKLKEIEKGRKNRPPGMIDKMPDNLFMGLIIAGMIPLAIAAPFVAIGDRLFGKIKRERKIWRTCKTKAKVGAINELSSEISQLCQLDTKTSQNAAEHFIKFYLSIRIGPYQAGLPFD